MCSQSLTLLKAELRLICKSYIKKQKTKTKAIFEKCILAKEVRMVQCNKTVMKHIHHLKTAIMKYNF